ncbi:hypothetical protein [Bacillus xiapuensis]|uniref:Phage protein n=1 Tax=Bacillus xiapuensis TaxID=2014075 RepID=A0ABU6NAH6_9BACI|nr:hypothetical protein [Bacillus xiapuensis]
MEELKQEQILEIDADQLEELMSGSEIDKLPPFQMELEDYNFEEFKRGINDTSYIAGVITALFNAGLGESSVLDYLLSNKTIDHNIEVAKINREMNVEVAKNAKLANDKYEL